MKEYLRAELRAVRLRRFPLTSIIFVVTLKCCSRSSQPFFINPLPFGSVLEKNGRLIRVTVLAIGLDQLEYCRADMAFGVCCAPGGGGWRRVLFADGCGVL